MSDVTGNRLWLSDGDAQFVACRDHVTKRGAREYVDAAYSRVRHLLPERDFATRIPREFTSRTWELRLIDWLLGAGFELGRPKSKGPDLHALEPAEFFVEAVAVQAGEQEDLPRRRGRKIIAHNEEPLLLRYTSALRDKAVKLAAYRRDEIVSLSAPLVIAVNASNLVDADLLDVPLPLILKVLFGIGEFRMAIPMDRAEPTRSFHLPRDVVRKSSTAEVRTDLFLTPQIAHVSAVLFSHRAVWNIPSTAGHDLLLAHNPFAINPLPQGLLSVGVEYAVADNMLAVISQPRDASGEDVE